MKITFSPIHLAVLALLISACATPPPTSVSSSVPPAKSPVAVAPPPTPAQTAAVPPAPAAPAVDTSAGERALLAAIASYDRGSFASAARQLSRLETDGSLDPGQLLRALKVLAFSQCYMNAVTACRQTFERALKADPTFDLLATERGQPTSDTQFMLARRTVLGK